MHALSLRSSARFLAICACTGICALAHADDGSVTVRVSGIDSAAGAIGCALFGPDDHFPLETLGARHMLAKAGTEGVVCRFDDVPQGTWAVAAFQDLNGNGRIDTNILGIPTEPWGVSNNVRPNFRAPRFDEASFRIAGGQQLVIDVKVAR